MNRQTEQAQWLMIKLHKEDFNNNAAVFSLERFTPIEENDSDRKERLKGLMKMPTRLKAMSDGDLHDLAAHAGVLLSHRLSRWIPELLRPKNP